MLAHSVSNHLHLLAFKKASYTDRMPHRRMFDAEEVERVVNRKPYLLRKSVFKNISVMSYTFLESNRSMLYLYVESNIQTL